MTTTLFLMVHQNEKIDKLFNDDRYHSWEKKCMNISMNWTLIFNEFILIFFSILAYTICPYKYWTSKTLWIIDSSLWYYNKGQRCLIKCQEILIKHTILPYPSALQIYPPFYSNPQFSTFLKIRWRLFIDYYLDAH